MRIARAGLPPASQQRELRSALADLERLGGSGAVDDSDPGLIATFHRGEALDWSAALASGDQRQLAVKLANAYREQLQDVLSIALKNVFALADPSSDYAALRQQSVLVAAQDIAGLSSTDKDVTTVAMEQVLEDWSPVAGTHVDADQLLRVLGCWKSVFAAFNRESVASVRPLDLQRIFSQLGDSRALIEPLRVAWHTLYDGSTDVAWPSSDTADLHQLVWALSRGRHLALSLDQLENEQSLHPAAERRQWNEWLGGWRTTRSQLADVAHRCDELVKKLGADRVKGGIATLTAAHRGGLCGHKSFKAWGDLDDKWIRTLAEANAAVERGDLTRAFKLRIESGAAIAAAFADPAAAAKAMAKAFVNTGCDPKARLGGEDPKWHGLPWTFETLWPESPDSGSLANGATATNASFGSSGSVRPFDAVARAAFRCWFLEALANDEGWKALCKLQVEGDAAATNLPLWLEQRHREASAAAHPLDPAKQMPRLAEPTVAVSCAQALRGVLERVEPTRTDGLGDEDAERTRVSDNAGSALTQVVGKVHAYWTTSYLEPLRSYTDESQSRGLRSLQDLNGARLAGFLDRYRAAMAALAGQCQVDVGAGRRNMVDPVVPSLQVAVAHVDPRLELWRMLAETKKGDWQTVLCAIDSRWFSSTDSIFDQDAGSQPPAIVDVLQRFNDRLNKECLAGVRNEIVRVWKRTVASTGGYTLLHELVRGDLGSKPCKGDIAELGRQHARFVQSCGRALEYMAAGDFVDLREFKRSFDGLSTHLAFVLASVDGDTPRWRTVKIRGRLEKAVANGDVYLRTVPQELTTKWRRLGDGPDLITKNTRKALADAPVEKLLTMDMGQDQMVCLLCGSETSRLLDHVKDKFDVRRSESAPGDASAAGDVGWVQYRIDGDLPLLRFLSVFPKRPPDAEYRNEVSLILGEQHLTLAFFQEDGRTPLDVGPFDMKAWQDPREDK